LYTVMLISEAMLKINIRSVLIFLIDFYF
jgi:hypothetical protein